MIGQKLLGRVNAVSFVDNGSHSGFLKSQSLWNCFVTLSMLIDVKDFVSYLSVSFFRWL